MATVSEIRAVMDGLCGYYRDRNNQPRELADVQKAAYLQGLAEFPAEQLQLAAMAWIRQSRWFPAVSDLRTLLIPPAPDWKSLALLAWTTFERAIGRAGVYRGVTFADPAIGECVRQTFGTWEHACSYERDSPGWTVRRQTFLALFPHIAERATEVVTLPGLGHGKHDTPLLIGPVEGMPDPVKALNAPDHSKDALAEVERRFARLQPPPTETP